MSKILCSYFVTATVNEVVAPQFIGDKSRTSTMTKNCILHQMKDGYVLQEPTRMYRIADAEAQKILGAQPDAELFPEP